MERERIHKKIIKFTKIAKHLVNHYGMEIFVSIRIIFTYERGGEKKSKFSGDSIIEDHWVKYNIITKRRTLNLDNLET